MGKNLFNSVLVKKPGRNNFDLTHDFKFSANMGYLIPTAVIECIPGDSFKLGCEALIKLAPMSAPPMQRIDVTFHWFFVPNRLTWENWSEWIVQEPGTTWVHPYISFDDTTFSIDMGTLPDYMGIPIPTQVTYVNPENCSALPFAAYQLIFNEYYRDENLVSEVDGVELTSGDNNANWGSLTELRTRAWEHDYFTSALPFAQKGAAVSLPIGEVVLGGTAPYDSQLLRVASTGALLGGAVLGTNLGSELNTSPATAPVVLDPNGTLEVAPTTITDLRRAFRLQEWLEKNARGGTRYIENILAHFGVRSSDARMQRPEYITGCKAPVVISEVLQTSESSGTPQANMAGHGVSVIGGKYGKYFCEEHGYIICIMSVLPKTAYHQGFPLHFLKRYDPFQYFWPEFQHIGEQPIWNAELYGYQQEGTGATQNHGTFGYIPRYAEYKFINSRIAGQFHVGGNLENWTQVRDFSSQPALDDRFVTSDPSYRTFADTDPTQHHLYCHVLNKVYVSRVMAKYGNPSF
ncbi:major capsid protein [Microvirus D_HF4_274]|nr:major capsid protein [Microvirus D_HF4_274]